MSRKTVFDIASREEIVALFWGPVYAEDTPEEMEEFLKEVQSFLENNEDSSWAAMANLYFDRRHQEKPRTCLACIRACLARIRNPELKFSANMLLFECMDPVFYPIASRQLKPRQRKPRKPKPR